MLAEQVPRAPFQIPIKVGNCPITNHNAKLFELWPKKIFTTRVYLCHKNVGSHFTKKVHYSVFLFMTFKVLRILKI